MSAFTLYIRAKPKNRRSQILIGASGPAGSQSTRKTSAQSEIAPTAHH
jgi:hypothetical protein